MSAPRQPGGALILVADDEPDIVGLLGIVLGRAGHRVIDAADGDTALAMAFAELPDLCILDGRMPGLHGFEVLRRLREDVRTERTPVLILTATVDEQREVSRHGIEPDAFMAKPFESEKLISEITRLLGSSGSER